MLRQHEAEIPRFEIVQVGVDMGKGSAPSERTRAYKIQCLHKDASRLSKMLQSGVFTERPVYVPYHMKRTKPLIFKSAIKKQIRTLADQWVIKITGFTTDMMEYVRAKVLESWATGIVPTRNEHRGEWKILVDRSNHAATLAWLQEHWLDIMESIPAEVAEASPHDNPKIACKVRDQQESDSEAGTVDTYGTILSALYYGVDQDDILSEDSEQEAPTATETNHRPVTYAQVMKDGNISTVSQVSWLDRPTKRRISSPTAETYKLRGEIHDSNSGTQRAKDSSQDPNNAATTRRSQRTPCKETSNI